MLASAATNLQTMCPCGRSPNAARGFVANAVERDALVAAARHSGRSPVVLCRWSPQRRTPVALRNRFAPRSASSRRRNGWHVWCWTHAAIAMPQSPVVLSAVDAARGLVLVAEDDR